MPKSAICLGFHHPLWGDHISRSQRFAAMYCIMICPYCSLSSLIIIIHHYSSLFIIIHHLSSFIIIHHLSSFIIIHHLSSFIIVHHYSSCIHFSWCFEILGLIEVGQPLEILQDFSKSSATQAANNLAGTLSQVSSWGGEKPNRNHQESMDWSIAPTKRCRKVCFLDVIHFSLFFIFWGHLVVYENGI